MADRQTISQRGYYPRRMCEDIVGNTKCRFRRVKPRVFMHDILCIHPLCGESGQIINTITNETFRAVGCSSFELSDTKLYGVKE